MKVIAWNSHRLGNLRIVCNLRDLLWREYLDVAFLQEIKVLASFFDPKRLFVDFSCCLVVDYKGRSGGLAVLWTKEMDFEVLGFLRSLIHG